MMRYIRVFIEFILVYFALAVLIPIGWAIFVALINMSSPIVEFVNLTPGFFHFTRTMVLVFGIVPIYFVLLEIDDRVAVLRAIRTMPDHVLDGYHKNPDETNKLVTSERWNALTPIVFKEKTEERTNFPLMRDIYIAFYTAFDDGALFDINTRLN